MKKIVRHGLLTLTSVTLILWLISGLNFSTLISAWPNTIAKISALIAITAVSWNLILSSRFKYFDKAFKGLDMMYKAHRHSGMIAFAFMLSHPVFLIVSALPVWDFMKIYILPGSIWAINFGIFALWLFVILLVLTLFIKLPYHIWKRTHQFMVLPYALVALHILTIQSDIFFYLPLRVWVIALFAFGFISYIYKVFLYRYIGPKYQYQIKDVKVMGNIIEIVLAAVGKKINFYPGQFVFINIEDKAIGKEQHPFSISSSPNDKNLRLSIKQMGDHTNKFSNLKKSMNITLYGPYGEFGKRFLSSNKDSLWIAGGIGITPFLSLLHYFNESGQNKKVALYYCTRDKDEAVYHNEIKDVSKECPFLNYYSFCSSEKGRIQAKMILDEIGNLTERLILLCGPMPMMKSLEKGFMELGVNRSNIIYEDFSLK
jgi:predicted ferric reductase